MRPVLFDVDVKSTPPRMTILFPGRPHRFIAVKIREPGETLHSASIAAVRELGAFTPDQLQLLAESSEPMAVAPDPAPETLTAVITKVEQETRYPGVVHCPACCHPLGRGDSPAIGYLETCSSCKRQLMVRFAPGSVTVILWTE